MQKIKCECGRWVMRVEKGGVYAICKRCGSEVRVEITALMVELEQELAASRGSQDEADPEALNWDTAVTTQKRLPPASEVPPKMFG